MSSAAQGGEAVRFSRAVLDDLPPHLHVDAERIVAESEVRAAESRAGLPRLAASHASFEHYSSRVMRREGRVP